MIGLDKNMAKALSIKQFNEKSKSKNVTLHCEGERKKFSILLQPKIKDIPISGYLDKNSTSVSQMGENQRYVTLTNAEEKEYTFMIRDKPKPFCYIQYAYLDDNTQIGIETSILPILIFLLLIIIFLAAHSPKSTNEDTISNKTVGDFAEIKDDINRHVEKEDEYIEFAGYSNTYVSKEKPSIQLINMESNDVYLTYTVYNAQNDEVLVDETDLIPPGKAFEWNAKEQLKTGDYDLYFVVKAYAADDQFTKLNEVTNDNIHLQVIN